MLYLSHPIQKQSRFGTTYEVFIMLNDNDSQQADLFAVLSDPALTASFFLKDVKIDGSGRLPDYPNLSIGQLTDQIWVTKYVPLYNVARTKYKNFNRLRKPEFDIAMRLIYTQAIEDAKIKLINSVFNKEQEGNYTEFNRFLKMAFPKEEVPNAMYEVALKLFIQQVKLKLLNQHDKIKYHYFPVIVGKQGLGKSLLIDALVAPLESLMFKIKLNQLKDITQIGPQFNRKYIAVADEMAGMKRTEIEDLKSIITSKTIDYRIYHSQDHVSALNNAVFIGSSNRGLAEIMIDDQSRRFIQIDLKDYIDFEERTKIDYLKVWQSVSTEKNYLTPGILAMIAEHQQEDLSTEDEVELFIEEYDLLEPTISSNIAQVQQVTLYSAYIQFADERGFYRHSLNSFAKKLKRLGLEASRQGRPQKRYYIITRAALKRLGNADYTPSKLEVRAPYEQD